MQGKRAKEKFQKNDKATAKLKATLQNATTSLINTSVIQLCQHVGNLVNKPWTHPVLLNIYHGEPSFSDPEGKFKIVNCSFIFDH